MERAKIGILGGTLDPVHNGHIALMRMARAQMRLERVLLLPAGDPPHKHCHAAAGDRLEMARLAAGDEFSLCEAEVRRPGKTYTVDTLRALRQQTGAELVYIIGADTLSQIASWREHEQVFALCSFAAVRRDGQGDARVPEGARVRWLDGDAPQVSSTLVRERAAVRAPLDGLTPPEVGAYIRARGLYLMDVPEEEAERRLRALLTPRRYRHTLGVRDTCERLAKIHGLDVAAARVAGLLHDVAKCLPFDEQVRLAGDLADERERADEQLVHAPAGVALAKERFGVRDEEILAAIGCHTLGGEAMTDLMLAVFVADFIEPGRADFPGLDQARALAGTDLRAAASKCANLTLQYVRKTGREAHPRTVRMLEQYGRDHPI